MAFNVNIKVKGNRLVYNDKSQSLITVNKEVEIWLIHSSGEKVLQPLLGMIARNDLKCQSFPHTYFTTVL